MDIHFALLALRRDVVAIRSALDEHEARLHAVEARFARFAHAVDLLTHGRHTRADDPDGFIAQQSSV